MFYFGKRYTVGQTAILAGSFRCRSCDFQSPVTVVGVGKGSGESPYALDDDGASDRARQNAAASALQDARELLALIPCVRCARCHRRDAGAVRRFKLRAALITLAPVAIFAGLGALLPRLEPGSTSIAYGLAALVGAIAMVLVGLPQLAQWRAMTTRITFGAPPEKPAKKAKRARKKARERQPL